MAAPTAPHAPLPSAQCLDGGAPPAYFLAIAGPNLQVAYPLPREGTLSLGRAEDADVRIPDAGISRYHARIVVREGFLVEDLGSHNGTYVRDTPIPAHVPVPLHPGEVLGLGATLVTIQRRSPATVQGRFVAHARLEARLIEECAHAEALGRSFALLRVDLAPGPAPAAAEAILLGTLRPGDLGAVYAPSGYALLFVDTDRAIAQAVVAKLARDLRACGYTAEVGAAYAPGDGRSPDALFAKACAEVRGSAAAGSAQEAAVVRNPAVRAVYQTAERAAQGTIAILIGGETGVGKELLAAAIHQASPRASQPFLSINCAAVAESVLESELFGHERGAFTGAHAAKVGLFEAAAGGTVFLDEVGEMRPTMQAKLLRVLETNQIQRVGAARPRAVNVRVVSATNRDLEEEVAEGRFRADLFYRLNGISLVLPPLRERTDEIEPIAARVVAKVAREVGRLAPAIAPAVLDLLRAYPWPGNIRELRNVLERAVLLCGGGRIEVEHLPEEKMRAAIERARGGAPAPEGSGMPAWWSRRVEAEKEAMREALERCRGNRTRAAELLGMPRSTFMRKLADHGLVGR